MRTSHKKQRTRRRGSERLATWASVLAVIGSAAGFTLVGGPAAQAAEPIVAKGDVLVTAPSSSPPLPTGTST